MPADASRSPSPAPEPAQFDAGQHERARAALLAAMTPAGVFILAAMFWGLDTLIGQDVFLWVLIGAAALAFPALWLRNRLRKGR